MAERYEYGRIKVLVDNLRKFGVREEIIGWAMEGGEAILRSTTPERKAVWLGEFPSHTAIAAAGMSNTICRSRWGAVCKA